MPVEEIRDIIPPGHSDYDMSLHNPLNDKFYHSACKLYMLEINNKNFLDFYNLYSEGKPVFYAHDIEPFKYYHSREDSMHFLHELLKFQMNNNEDKIIELLGNIKSWFNRKGWNAQRNGKYVLNAKINTVDIHGPPNSGKNYFWDCFAAIANNVGHIGRVSNKTNQFSMHDAYNRRLVIGNELNMEDSAKDDFKKLCEGAAFNIKVKFQGDKIFSRTPVCFISNAPLDLIVGDRDFINVRIISFRWKPFSYLANSVLKPFPLAMFDIFKYYNVSLD